MTWADRRKHVIEAILVACAVAVIALVFVATLYKTPSCFDGKQNQGENGIDCGGPCPYACSANETTPSVRFARAVSPEPGRQDLISYIDNSNNDAELVNARYVAEFYGANQTVIAQKTGFLTVPPSTTMPIFIPNMYQGGSPVTQVFLTIDPASLKWLRTSTKPIVPIPQNENIEAGTTNAPKITAELMNPTAQALSNVTVVATVFNAANNAIAASQTVVQTLAPQSSSPIIFTWNEAFPGAPARVEILPASPSSI